MTYHVGPNGKPSVCKAKKGNCPYESISPHFETADKAQLYSDNLNDFIARNITTETTLYKHCKIEEIIESQNMLIRLEKTKLKEQNLLEQANAQYLKLEKIMKKINGNVQQKKSLFPSLKRMILFILQRSLNKNNFIMTSITLLNIEIKLLNFIFKIKIIL